MVFIINEGYTVVVNSFLGLIEYIFNHHGWTTFEFYLLSIFELKSALSLFTTSEWRCATQPSFILLIPIDLVIIVRSITFEGRYGWMVRHLLAIYPFTSDHLALESLSEYWIDWHLAIGQSLIDEITSHKKFYYLFHSFQRIAHRNSLVQILQRNQIILNQVQLSSFVVDVRRSRYLEHIHYLPFHSSWTYRRCDMLNSLDDFTLAII